MTDQALALYLALLVGSRLAEALCATRRARGWPRARDWTFLALFCSYLVAVAAPVVEYSLRAPVVAPVPWAVGVGLFLASLVLRCVALRHLGEAFAPVVQTPPGERLVESGPYRRVRHPLYLGNLLQLAGLPLLLGGEWSYLASLVCAVAVVVRVRVEERYLRAHLEEYAEYMRRTWALLPGVW